uniref:Uncharacterized protein n=1 Tax=Anguilla anguilla TaxID=7936 RepID=A0A0E9X5W1_ANGAN
MPQIEDCCSLAKKVGKTLVRSSAFVWVNKFQWAGKKKTQENTILSRVGICSALKCFGQSQV